MAEDTYHSTFDRRWAVRLTAPEKAMVECLDGGEDSNCDEKNFVVVT